MLTESPVPLVVVIVARDEAGVIGDTLADLRRFAAPGDLIAVCDDGSTDGTGEIAARLGARVYRRPHPPPRPEGHPSPLSLPERGERSGVGGEVGKGAALKWWLETAWEAVGDFAGIVILDADSRADAGFLAAIRARMAASAQAVQAFVVPVGAERSGISALAAFSELLEQQIGDRARAALRWPVRLRGTGMAFRPTTLRQVTRRLRTQVEDVEISLLLAAQGIHVEFAPEARVFDPKPAGAGPAARQRARWLRGQFDVLRLYPREIIGLMLRGPWAWSLLGSLLFKPRSLIIACKALLAIGLLGLPALPIRNLGLAALGVSLLADAAYYLIGLLIVDEARLVLRRPPAMLVYLLMWLRGAALAAAPPRGWLSARGPRFPYPLPVRQRGDGAVTAQAAFTLTAPSSAQVAFTLTAPSSAQANRPTLAVVVPTLNGHTRLSILLEALRRQSRPPDEVILVEAGADAAGGRRRIDEFMRAGPAFEVRLIVNPSGTIPAGLNLGIGAAGSEIIARLDAHALPSPDYLQRCLEALDGSGADMVGGRWEIRAGAAGPAAAAIALAVGHPLGAGDARYRRQSPARAGDVDTVPYGCFRKETWRRLGGFDESLLTNEDYEFNWRVRASGGRVVFDPAICSTYFARGTLPELARQYFRYGWWKAQMLRRHPTSIRLRQLLPIGGLALLAACLAASPFNVPIRNAALLLCLLYAATTGLAGLQLAFRRRSPALLVTLPLALWTVHFAWSSGAWANFLTGGRWPRWRGAPRATAPSLEAPSPARITRHRPTW